jgi:hypothetical protein
MSTNFVINQNTKQKYDTNSYDTDRLGNDLVFNYNFMPSVMVNQDSRSSYLNSTQTAGILQNNNYDIQGKNIQENTNIRNGLLQPKISKKELDTRLFPGAPLMSNGQSVLKNPDLSSRLLFGEDTRVSKSNNPSSSYSADNFIPMVPALAENIQNTDHIIPTYWVRGGMSSRSVIRNIDYLKACGIKK